MKKQIIPIVIVFIALVFVLPGIAIARQSSASDQEGSLSDRSNNAVLIGGEYYLILQPAPAANGISTNSGNSLKAVSHAQYLGQTIKEALKGGSYMLSQPRAVNDSSGCCCKNYLACIHK